MINPSTLALRISGNVQRYIQTTFTEDEQKDATIAALINLLCIMSLGMNDASIDPLTHEKLGETIETEVRAHFNLLSTIILTNRKSL